jgi:hypothetical protein
MPHQMGMMAGGFHQQPGSQNSQDDEQTENQVDGPGCTETAVNDTAGGQPSHFFANFRS